MKMSQIVIVAASLLLMNAPQAWGQFDLGKVFKEEIRRGAQQFQGEVRGAVQEWRQGGPPPQILPYPPMPTPRPIVRPHPIITPQPWQPDIGPPVETIICPTPPVTTVIALPTSPSETVSESAEAEVALPQVAAGELVSIDGIAFGEQPGAVYVIVGELILFAELVEWTDTEVSAILPNLPMINTVEADVAVMTSEQNIAEQLTVQLRPADEDAEDVVSEVPTTDETELPLLELGDELVLEGESMGDHPGSASFQIGPATHQATIAKWSASEVKLILPDLPMPEPKVSVLKLFDATGKLISEFDITLVNEVQ